MAMLLPGELAPHFTLLGLDGREYSLPRDTAGEPLLIAFFRVTCSTCDLALPYFNRLQSEYLGGWRLWMISQDNAKRTAAYREKFGIMAPTLMDAPSLDVSLMYDPESVPALLLVGPNGRVDFTLEEFDKPDMNEISRRIAEYIGASPVEVALANDGNPQTKAGCPARQRIVRRRG